MKKHLLIAVMALVLVSFSSSAMAADTAQVTVTATVVGTCQFTTSAGTMAFGNLTASDVGPVSVAPVLQFWCTNGAAYTITDDEGANEAVADTLPARLSDGGGNFIVYSYTYTAGGFGAGPGSPINLDFAGSVLEANYAAQPTGGYSDLVTLSILP